jgi:glutaredoxin
MRQVLCTNPDCPNPVTRTNSRFTPGDCPHCKEGKKAINIKGTSDLALELPDTNYVDMRGRSTIPRRIRPKSKFP